jgi:membrane protein required for beta-lactamase induction
MAITDTLYVVSILIGLFIVHFGIPVLLLWLLKVLVCWALREPDTV